MHLTFVGGGNMATALIGGLRKKGLAVDNVKVVEIDADARERLAMLGVQTYSDLASAAAGAECVVLAVKPQQLREVAANLAPRLNGALVITIAAGVRVEDLSRWLGGHDRIVRAMPNTPALVLSGMTGLYAPPGVSEEDRKRAEQLLSAAGHTSWVEHEDQMDAVTAVSGSGPAYVFYFIEALQQAARELGFDRAAARDLALHTFQGAVRLALDDPEDVATLRARVTSKGGTTESALRQLERDRVSTAIVRAVHAAAERSRELGIELGAKSSSTG